MKIESKINDSYKLVYTEEDDSRKLTFFRGQEELASGRFDLDNRLLQTKTTTPWVGNLIKLFLEQTLKNENENVLKAGINDAFADIKSQYKKQVDEIHNVQELEKKGFDEESLLQTEMCAGEFDEFLHENNMNIFDFIRWCSMWSLANEEENFTMGLLAAISTMTGIKPLWFMATGASSKGKTFLMQAIFSMLPNEFIMSGRMYEAAMYRLSMEKGPDVFDKKWINYGDLGGDYSVDKWTDSFDIIKELSTEGEIDKLITGEGKNDQTGERQTLNLQLIGHPAATFTTVHQEKNKEQYQNRGFEVTPQATDEDVAEFELRVSPGKYASDYIEHMVNPKKELFKAWLKQRSLETEDLNVINPYEKCLMNWVSDSKNVRRESNSFKLMVGIVARLNADPTGKRNIKDADGREYVVATKEDNMIVTNIFNPARNISPLEIEIFNMLVDKVKPFDQEEYENFEERNGHVTMQNAKSFFTGPSLKRRQLKRLSPEIKEKMHSILLSLKQEGYLDTVEEARSDDAKIYYLTEGEKITSKPIIFDNERIEKYINNYILGRWGYKIDKDEFMNIFNQEPEPREESYGDLEIPPWYVRSEHKIGYESTDVEVKKVVAQQTL